ncbi:MAG TPA: carbamoyltransferase C-terminal domain-containing protein [Propionibacteriaceae bacterium]|jgi:carbamoyltransferase|nr:carbamoyltransferase C-terminal domain-containing protein [Propionibacteriaceae bacterium]
MRILGINALYHDPSAALVVDGTTVAAAEEERFSRRKHGKRPVPFSAWEQPELSAAWCLDHAGVRPDQLDAVTYSFDPALRLPPDELGLHDPWDDLRQTYAERAPGFLAAALPGLDPARVRFVPHHVAHAASAGLAAPFGGDCAVLVLDGRGERHSHLAGRFSGGALETLYSQQLPHSLGLLYEDATQHLGFLRSSDEYKVMALASYGKPRHLDYLRQFVRATGDGGFRSAGVDWSTLAPPRSAEEPWTADHADLASSLQTLLEEVLLELTGWLHAQTGAKNLTLAGGVALNCVANTRIFTESGFEQVWVQPAAGDAGTALGGALYVAQRMGEDIAPFPGADLGREWTDDDLEAALRTARIPYDRPPDIADAVAEALAADGIVAWFQGRSEFGPRALGHRSLLAHPGRESNLRRLNDVKGREQFRPVAPMVLASRAAELFSRGPIPSPYMLFVHDVADGWRDRIPAAVHVDGTARIQSVDPATEPLVARMLQGFEQRTGLPVVINTSLNTAGRPMVDSPRDALECFGSTPVDLLAIGPFAVRRRSLAEHE